MKGIFSVDVEDWFHILDLPSSPVLAEWDALPSRVEGNFRTLLDLFSRYKVKSTCFFLGWVAQKYPHLVREASALGHEVASHGYSHRLVYQMSAEEFERDICDSKHILEDITGRQVIGYRAPGFSATGKTPWFFEKLSMAGFRYDSSVFPARRSHGGMASSPCAPYIIGENSPHSIVEFPMSVVEILSVRLCFFGGGYLRLSPWELTKKMASKVMKEGRPVIFYIHPREIDPDQPRLRMSASRTFKSYVNLGSTHGKLERIMAEFEMTTFRRFLEEHWSSVPAPKGVGSEVAIRAQRAAG